MQQQQPPRTFNPARRIRCEPSLAQAWLKLSDQACPGTDYAPHRVHIYTSLSSIVHTPPTPVGVRRLLLSDGLLLGSAVPQRASELDAGLEQPPRHAGREQPAARSAGVGGTSECGSRRQCEHNHDMSSQPARDRGHPAMHRSPDSVDILSPALDSTPSTPSLRLGQHKGIHPPGAPDDGRQLRHGQALRMDGHGRRTHVRQLQVWGRVRDRCVTMYRCDVKGMSSCETPCHSSFPHTSLPHTSFLPGHPWDPTEAFAPPTKGRSTSTCTTARR